MTEAEKLYKNSISKEEILKLPMGKEMDAQIETLIQTAFFEGKILGSKKTVKDLVKIIKKQV